MNGLCDLTEHYRLLDQGWLVSSIDSRFRRSGYLVTYVRQASIGERVLACFSLLGCCCMGSEETVDRFYRVIGEEEIHFARLDALSYRTLRKLPDPPRQGGAT